jgi:hypothetical protein
MEIDLFGRSGASVPGKRDPSEIATFVLSQLEQDAGKRWVLKPLIAIIALDCATLALFCHRGTDHINPLSECGDRGAGLLGT